MAVGVCFLDPLADHFQKNGQAVFKKMGHLFIELWIGYFRKIGCRFIEKWVGKFWEIVQERTFQRSMLLIYKISLFLFR